MITARIHSSIALLPVLSGLAMTLLVSSAPAVHAAPDDNLPVFTSPIDITGLKVQLQAAAPDRDTGNPVEVSLPVELLGPKMNQLFATPLSTQLDQAWSVNQDPLTGKTQREQACDGKDGIKAQVSKQISEQDPSLSAYDISCNLASTGQLLVKQVGSTLYLGYLLTNNTVTFAVTTPATCNANNGTFLCPNDPRFQVTFASQIETVVRTPSICQLNAEGGTVNTQAVTIDSTNGTGAVATLIDELFLGHKFSAAERAIEAAERQTPLPLEDSFAELRTSDACTGNSFPVSLFRTAFRDFETIIDLQKGIIFRASHVGITPPTIEVPNPGVDAGPSQPSFTRPMIATTQPIVTAGNAVQLSGQHFPLNLNLATALPVTMHHGGYGENSSLLGAGVCFGGATELEWGQVGNLAAQPIQGDAQGNCVEHFDATNLTAMTAYQFRARDCDAITCSPWSAPLEVTTARDDDAEGTVVLTLDSGTPLGTTTVSALGTFESTIEIPASTAAGTHTIHAVNGDAKAEVALQVTAPTPSGRSNGSIMIVGLLAGETGCPNHPITSTQTDSPFTLFGTGFAAGNVTIHLDSASGTMLGTAPVRTDGSICQQMQGIPGSQAGAHTLVAVQNGTVQAQATITFVLPSVVR